MEWIALADAVHRFRLHPGRLLHLAFLGSIEARCVADRDDLEGVEVERESLERYLANVKEEMASYFEIKGRQ